MKHLNNDGFIYYELTQQLYDKVQDEVLDRVYIEVKNQVRQPAISSRYSTTR